MVPAYDECTKNVRPLQSVQMMEKVHCLRRNWHKRVLCVTFIASFSADCLSQHSFHVTLNTTFVWMCRLKTFCWTAPSSMGRYTGSDTKQSTIRLQQLADVFLIKSA